MGESLPVAIVIYGASGDLSQLKLVPAVYELAREKLLSDKFVLVGYARSKDKKDPTTKQVLASTPSYVATESTAPAAFPRGGALLVRVSDSLYAGRPRDPILGGYRLEIEPVP